MTFTTGLRVVLGAFGLWALFTMSRQCRRPTGATGRRVARLMNVSHARVTAWGLGHVTVGPASRVLDVGCGGGQTVRRLAEMATHGHVSGVDYAPASVAIAQTTNADGIASGRVDVQQASVSQLPFANRSFDLVTAVETHYYWPDLPRDLRETLRVLVPGGRLAIIAETYRGTRWDWLYRPAMRLILRATYLSLEDHRAALVDAGFTDVLVHEDRAHGWMCAVGTRP